MIFSKKEYCLLKAPSVYCTFDCSIGTLEHNGLKAKRTINENEINCSSRSLTVHYIRLVFFMMMILAALCLFLSFLIKISAHEMNFKKFESSFKVIPLQTNDIEIDQQVPVKLYLNEYTVGLNKFDFNNVGKKLPLPPPPTVEQCANIAIEDRFDCFPRGTATEKCCEERGCCWTIPKTFLHSSTSDPTNIPHCYYPKGYGNYKFINSSVTKFGATAFMEAVYQSPYPKDINLLKLDVHYETNERLHVKISDPVMQRYEPPYPEVPIVDRTPKQLSYHLEIDKDKMGFKIIRSSNNATIFDSQDIGALIFADQFLQLSALLPSRYIYGLGEHRNNFILDTNWNRITLFNHDREPTDQMNGYGTHPFYMVMEPGGNSHGVFLLNSNGMEITLQPAPAITYRVIGGVLDFYFLLGPTPASVVSQYTEIVGRPHMPPYWGLGFHLCRFGYPTLRDLIEVWNRTRVAGIPLDTQWSDLDYMSDRNDFTYNKTSYNGLPEFVEHLHDEGMHFVPIYDPGVSAAETPGSYPPFDDGLKMNIFIKDSGGKKPFIGKVWNRISTAYPDFTHPKVVEYWIMQLRRQHLEFAFDGTWIDMNEPSNFLNGGFKGCPNTSWDHPPYLPIVDQGELIYKTVCMSAVQHAGFHYNLHNLYGFSEAIVTSFAMAEIRQKRPFIISRSSFAGHGHYAGHWTGDIHSTWDDMKHTVGDVLSFNLFGVPLVGADICGFNGNTTPALCQRWSQLGAFYPFSRNHNSDDTIAQDPVALGAAVVQSARLSLEVRYTLLPYLYTLFFQAHARGLTVARPLFFEFPQDEQTYPISTSFLWGSALLIAPVLTEGASYVKVYLPAGRWYDFYTSEAINSIGGQEYTLAAPEHQIPLLLRGGNIVPTQRPSNTTTLSRKNPMGLIVAVDGKGEAQGVLYWDDGDSLESFERGHFNLIKFRLKNSTLESIVALWSYKTSMLLGNVSVVGVTPLVTSVTVNGAEAQFSYSPNKKKFVIQTNIQLDKEFKIIWK